MEKAGKWMGKLRWQASRHNGSVFTNFRFWPFLSVSFLLQYPCRTSTFSLNWSEAGLSFWARSTHRCFYVASFNHALKHCTHVDQLAPKKGILRLTSVKTRAAMPRPFIVAWLFVAVGAKLCVVVCEHFFRNDSRLPPYFSFTFVPTATILHDELAKCAVLDTAAVAMPLLFSSWIGSGCWGCTNAIL